MVSAVALLIALPLSCSFPVTHLYPTSFVRAREACSRARDQAPSPVPSLLLSLPSFSSFSFSFPLLHLHDLCGKLHFGLYDCRLTTTTTMLVVFGQTSYAALAPCVLLPPCDRSERLGRRREEEREIIGMTFSYSHSHSLSFYKTLPVCAASLTLLASHPPFSRFSLLLSLSRESLAPFSLARD